MNIVSTPSLYCGFSQDFQFLKPIEYYDDWVSYMTDTEYHWDQLEKSVGSLENSMNILVSDLKELRKKRRLLKLYEEVDPLAWARVVGVELHMREIEKVLQNCELTKSIVLNELACKEIPMSSKEAKEVYNPKFTYRERRLIEENLKKGKRGEKKRMKMEEKLERMQLGEMEYNESRNKKKNVKKMTKMIFKKEEEKKNGRRKEKAANNKVEY